MPIKVFIIRGGAWTTTVMHLCSDHYNGSNPSFHDFYLSFRLIKRIPTIKVKEKI